MYVRISDVTTKPKKFSQLNKTLREMLAIKWKKKKRMSPREHYRHVHGACSQV